MKKYCKNCKFYCYDGDPMGGAFCDKRDLFKVIPGQLIDNYDCKFYKHKFWIRDK